MSSCSDSPAETVGVQRSSPHQVFIPRISRHQTLDGETLPGAARFLHRTITKTCLAKTEPAMVHRGGFPNPADIHYSGPCLVMCNVWQCNCVRCLHPCMVTRYSAGGGYEAESGNQSVVTNYTISTQHPACAGSAGVQQSARYAGETRRLGGEGDSCQSGLIVTKH